MVLLLKPVRLNTGNPITIRGGQLPGISSLQRGQLAGIRRCPGGQLPGIRPRIPPITGGQLTGIFNFQCKLSWGHLPGIGGQLPQELGVSLGRNIQTSIKTNDKYMNRLLYEKTPHQRCRLQVAF